MQLKELIEQLSDVTVEGSLDREVAGLAYDSRRVTPGMVFVALPGLRTDGHAYIADALDRGAAAVICERNGLSRHKATKICVRDTRVALALAAIAYFQNPSARLKLIGVTGTNGKTTVAFLIKHILETAGLASGLVGTVRYEIGDRVIPAQRTTPEALDLQQLLAQMLHAKARACVMEVSSHALDQKRVFGLQFDIALFTNLTRDHLDYHGSMESYFAAKKKLFDALERGPKPATAVINIDDPFGARLAAESGVEVLLSYGLHPTARIRAATVELSPHGSRFLVETPTRKFPCRLPLIGRHNVYNALAAVGAATALGIKELTIQAALNAAPPVPGRLESIVGGQPFTLFVDYAHTDDALRNVLATLREITTGRLLLTFGCGGNRDPGKRSRMGRVAAELADLTIITSDNPRNEDPAAIAAQIEQGFRSVRDQGFAVELDRRRAIQQLIGQAQPGDALLIAGKGHEAYQEFDDTVIPFDDRIHARETLEALGFCQARP